MVNQKDLLRSIDFCVVAIVLGLGLGTNTLAQTRPNIIIIFTDDQGYQDLGCFGSPDIRTPHIDGLAEQGIRFTDFYVTASVCTPSRASLLTGRYAFRNGVDDVFLPDSRGMRSSEITIAEILKQGGYKTACFGKWHLGDLEPGLPTNQGFDEYLGIPYSNGMGLGETHKFSDTATLQQGYTLEKIRAFQEGRFDEIDGDLFEGQDPLFEGHEVVEYPCDLSALTRRYFDRAVEFIDRSEAENKPFFLYITPAMPHVPLAATKQFLGKSKGGLYGDTVEEIDWHVGRLVKHLKDKGLSENTMVIFASDNGPWLRYGEHGGCAEPLRAGKSSVYEGGVRVPCVMHWKGKWDSGRTSHIPISTIDLLPTIAHYADVPLPDVPIDGVNIADHLEDTEVGVDREYILFNSEGHAICGIRSGEWKLLPYGGFPDRDDDNTPELYNLADDISETTNLYRERPGIVRILSEEIDALNREFGLPSFAGHDEDFQEEDDEAEVSLKPMPFRNLPAAVREKARHEYPDAPLMAVEIQRDGSQLIYHVMFEVNGTEAGLKLNPQGEILDTWHFGQEEDEEDVEREEDEREQERRDVNGTVEHDVMIPMRDGIKLATDVYIPSGEGPFPVIIERTPYGRGGEEGEGFRYTERGYACVIQSCRGRRNSEGEWEPFVNERDDGLDTHAWILKQPWCNGKIGTIGGSYSGITAWSVAADSGPSHKVIVTSNPLMDGYRDLVNIGGAFGLGTLMTWGSMMARPTTGEIEEYDADAVDHWDWDKAFRRLPLSEWDKNLGFKVPYMRNWIKHEAFNKYWEPSDISQRVKDVDVPGVITTGWYDLFNSQAFKNVSAMREHARDAKGRMQYLVCGPWSHGGRHARHFGDNSDFRGDADLSRHWLDYWLQDKEMDLDSLPPYRLFVMGRNKWRTADQWPLKDTQFTPWYFHSSGSANTLNGNGTLSMKRPNEQPADTYTYDPSDPVPTMGGNHLAELGAPIGAHDQQDVECREDVLVYTSEPVKEELEVTGPVRVVLYGASSARDTDWTAKLVVVEPDGTAYNLCDGIQRARWREGDNKSSLIEPGKIYRYEIDLWMTSNAFLPGQRIRVDISSSNFPRFDRNPNTGNPFGQDAELKTAEQTVYHNSMYPSHIILPVIPADR